LPRDTFLKPKDELPETIILGPGGVRNLGLVDDAAAKTAGVPEGPIVLQEGYPGPRGWGWRHATGNARRVKEINERGFATPLAFACAVAASWTRLHDCGDGRISVSWHEKGFELAVALRWKGQFWSITTMLPFRVHHYPVLYEK